MRELSYDFIVSNLFLKDFKEELWVGTELVREAWCTELPEAEPIIDDLISAFPDITIEYLKSNKSNMIGYAANYRPPYSNGCVSWYAWEYPSVEDHAEYNIWLPDGCKLNRWFGKKFDMVTKEVWLKYVFSSKTMRKPPIPKCKIEPFYAMISDQNGNVLPQVDVYFNSTHADVRQHCEEYGLLYPDVPHLELEERRLWAFVYDYDTLEISKVKAYDIFNFKKRQTAAAA
jgi:hypothetical protein